MGSIDILNIGFILCLAIAILFFIISIVLFFVFDIRTIFSIRSGRAQAKTVKEMQEANANTGRLRIGKHTQTSKLSKAPQTTAQPVQSNVPQREEDITERLSESDGSAETTILDSQASAGADETQVLSFGDSYAETSVLGSNPEPASQAADPAPAIGINFEIIKKVIWRDTEEVI